MKAKEIMTSDVVSVTSETSIYKALELITASDLSALPVVEKDMTLIGIISEHDIIRLMDEDEDKDEDEDERTVYDFMTQPVVHFDENESLQSVCDFLKNNSFRRVPITSEGKLVGIISIKDVARYIVTRRRNRLWEKLKK